MATQEHWSKRHKKLAHFDIIFQDISEQKGARVGGGLGVRD